ncbi:MAG: TatD family hydrolase [Anaerolineales bacterium]
MIDLGEGWVDTHCHLTAAEFDGDRDEVLSRARLHGVTGFIVPGVDPMSSRAAVRMAEGQDGIRAAVGIHPHRASQWSPSTENEIRALARSEQVVAVGEIGLDYFRLLAPAEDQERAFRDQLDLATECGLPVILHHRDSLPKMLEILTEWASGLEDDRADRRGVLHAYSGDETSARLAIEQGFYIGAAGPITFRNAADRRALFSRLPMDRLLLETDSPYLTPHPLRGKRNEPSYLPAIGEELARVRQVDAARVRTETTHNARTLFAGRHGTYHRDVL